MVINKTMRVNGWNEFYFHTTLFLVSCYYSHLITVEIRYVLDYYEKNTSLTLTNVYIKRLMNFKLWPNEAYLLTL